MNYIDVIKLLVAELERVYKDHLELIDMVMPSQVNYRKDIERNLKVLQELDQRYDISLSDLDDVLNR